MAAGGFVGRVGALAVALGVGAAVATTGPAIAWAEPTSSDSSDSGAESASGPPSGSGPSAASRTGRPNPARIVRDSIKAVTDGVKEGRPASTVNARRRLLRNGVPTAPGPAGDLTVRRTRATTAPTLAARRAAAAPRLRPQSPIHRWRVRSPRF